MTNSLTFIKATHFTPLIKLYPTKNSSQLLRVSCCLTPETGNRIKNCVSHTDVSLRQEISRY